MNEVARELEVACFHCGGELKSDYLKKDNHLFCCIGCCSVYDVLSANNLSAYYAFNAQPGKRQSESVAKDKFAYLDLPEIKQTLITFQNDQMALVRFEVPAIHCTSCIWLLENLHKLDAAVISSQVDFTRRVVSISWDQKRTGLRQLVELLSRIGYEPRINLDANAEEKPSSDKRLLYRIGVAGFCFGNMMLLSFPEYLGIDTGSDTSLRQLFTALNVALSIPVFFYSGWIYIAAAWENIKHKSITIDFPLALGLIVLLVRSLVDIALDAGPGYLDTLAGLAFFLLIGRWFQQRSFDVLSFDRDYRSYFPLAIRKWEGEDWQPVQVEKLATGDRIQVRNGELIPADAILMRGNARIDYSFVTGESLPKKLVHGELVYAGGRQEGDPIELEVIKPVNQSYLTSLWNQGVFAEKQKDDFVSFQTRVSRWFTVALLLIAFGSALFWLPTDWARGLNALTAVLIIGCPCALALSSPFALGNALRILGKHGFYLRNTRVVEKLAKADLLIFDKTGTITYTDQQSVVFSGTLSNEEKAGITTAASASLHPLSQAVFQLFSQHTKGSVSHFEERSGQGWEACVDGRIIRLGNPTWVGITVPITEETRTYLSIDGVYRGYFIFQNAYRKYLDQTLLKLGSTYQLALLSGDHEGERERLSRWFSGYAMYFRQSPFDKLEQVANWTKSGHRTVMLGDGLNDAGALKAATVGISVSERMGLFTPASDAIMEASVVSKLPEMLKFTRSTMAVIYGSFAVSFMYNVVGLTFAVQGNLSPLIAAILMPLSSVTIIAFTTFGTRAMASKTLRP